MIRKIRKTVAVLGVGAVAAGTLALAAPAGAENIQAPIAKNPDLDGITRPIPEPPSKNICELHPEICIERPDVPGEVDPGYPGDPGDKDEPENPEGEDPGNEDEYPEDENEDYPEDGEWEEPGYDYPSHVVTSSPQFTG